MNTANQGKVLMAGPSQSPAKAARTLWEWRLLRRSWRFFTSVRLALILILIITAAVLAGTLLMQAPPSVMANPASYDQWLEQARAKYGIWTGPLEALQFFNVFHSLWFRLLIGLLTINIIVCSVNRWKGIWSMVFPARVRMGDAFFEHARLSARLDADMPPAVAVERAKRAFARSRYRVKTQTSPDAIAFIVDKNRFSRFGTFFSHLSIILILAGAIIGGIWGISDPGFVVSEGEIRDLGMGTNISVELEHFADEYYLEGPPKDFRSELIIYDNGVEVKRGTVRVNTPMSYGGYRFHQSFFGNTAVMDVRDQNGTVLFENGVALAWQTQDGRPVGSFRLPERNLTVYVVGPLSGWDDPAIPAGEMRVEIYRQDTGTLVTMENLIQGTPEEVADLTFTFQRERRFTGLRVVKDPGVNIIWAACGFMILGLVMLFYFPPRRLWALCKSRPDGTTEFQMATTAQTDMSATEEFRELTNRVRLALGIAAVDSDDTEGGNDDV